MVGPAKIPGYLPGDTGIQVTRIHSAEYPINQRSVADLDAFHDAFISFWFSFYLPVLHKTFYTKCKNFKKYRKYTLSIYKHAKSKDMHPSWMGPWKHTQPSLVQHEGQDRRGQKNPGRVYQIVTKSYFESGKPSALTRTDDKRTDQRGQGMHKQPIQPSSCARNEK